MFLGAFVCLYICLFMITTKYWTDLSEIFHWEKVIKFWERPTIFKGPIFNVFLMTKAFWLK